MKHIEMPIGSQLNINLQLNYTNTVNPLIQSGTAFLSDELGNNILDASLAFATDNATNLQYAYQLAAPTTADVRFHDVHLSIPTITSSDNATVTTAFLILLPAINSAFTIGEWGVVGGDGAVPEPITATLGLMGLGVLGMATRRRVG